MSRNDIGISAESVVDLPKSLVESLDIDIIKFYVRTETGVFRDGDEISSKNVVEFYRKGGSSLITTYASVDEYVEFFRSCLEHHSEIIHIAVSSGTSEAYIHALKARDHLGLVSDRIKIVDSLSISTGIGHLVMTAAKMRSEGRSSDDIVNALEEMRHNVSASFISMTPEQMFRNGRMSKAAKKICSTLRVHPVFAMKEGKIRVTGIGFGKMEHAIKRYVRKSLRNRSGIDTERLFITYAGCSLGEITDVKKEVGRLISFDEIIVTDTSATISCNCGEGTVGLLYLKKN